MAIKWDRLTSGFEQRQLHTILSVILTTESVQKCRPIIDLSIDHRCMLEWTDMSEMCKHYREFSDETGWCGVN